MVGLDHPLGHYLRLAPVAANCAILASITDLTTICFLSQMRQRQIRMGNFRAGSQPIASQAEGREFESRLPLQIQNQGL